MSVVPFRREPSIGLRRGRDVASAVRSGQRGADGDGRLLVVGGGKGGTGKSLMAANLAVLAALRGQRVVLVDADLGLANLHLLLGVEPGATLLSLLEARPSAIPARSDLLHVGPAGVALLAGASGVGRLAGLNRGDLRRLVHRLEPFVEGAELVLVDLSSGISPSTRLFLRAADEVVLVANPEPSAMLDAYGVIKLLSEAGHSGAVRLVMNRSRGPARGEQSCRRILQTVRTFLGREIDVLGCVPEDEAVTESVRRRRPLVLDERNAPAAAALREIAVRLLEDGCPAGNTISSFFLHAKGFLAPRRGRRKGSSCAL